MDIRRVPGGAIAKRLLADKRVDTLQLEMALSHAERVGESILDSLIDCRVINEEELLKYVANIYKTQFVSTQKLSRASIPQQTLALVPARAAENLGICPIVYDSRTDTVSVVIADTDNPDLLREMQMAIKARHIRVLIARPAAVYAMIGKHYQNDLHAFATFQERMLENSMGNKVPEFGGKSFGEDDLGDEISSPGRVARISSEPASWKRMANPAVVIPKIALPTIELSKSPSEHVVAPTIASNALRIPNPSLGGGQTAATSAVSMQGYIETLNVLVSLIERSRPGLRGHSAKVSELCGRLAHRLGLSQADTEALHIAAFIHDLGKSYDSHLVAWYVAEHRSCQVDARASYKGPIELFMSAHLPQSTVQIIEHLYERFDGGGFPHGLSGTQIPLGARILALIESYAELVSNPHNVYERILRASEALEVLKGFVNTVFDPKLFENFQAVALGDGLRSTLRPPKARVLLIDSNLDQIAPIELRFIEQGYSVEVTSDANEALKLIETQNFGLVISEVELSAMNGFELLTQVRKHVADLPWIYLTSQADRQSVSKGFACGASDYLIKPTAVDVIVTKAQQIIESHHTEQSSAGMAGSLKQMGIPEIVQVFAHGRKSGKLRVDSSGKSGEVHFSSGEIFNARYGELVGEKAFYAMLRLTDGQFFVDPTFVATQRVIHASAESLLLEGMRLLDEEGRG